jgi:hypothetical protein
MMMFFEQPKLLFQPPNTVVRGTIDDPDPTKIDNFDNRVIVVIFFQYC